MKQGPWEAAGEFTLIQLSHSVSAVFFSHKGLWCLADLCSKWKRYGMGAAK